MQAGAELLATSSKGFHPQGNQTQASGSDVLPPALPTTVEGI